MHQVFPVWLKACLHLICNGRLSVYLSYDGTMVSNGTFKWMLNFVSKYIKTKKVDSEYRDTKYWVRSVRRLLRFRTHIK